ncbi:unnamed protein product [Brassica oleracea]
MEDFSGYPIHELGQFGSINLASSLSVDAQGLQKQVQKYYDFNLDVDEGSSNHDVDFPGDEYQPFVTMKASLSQSIQRLMLTIPMDR